MIVTNNEANLIRCCGPEGCGEEKLDVRWCIGSNCMAWDWSDGEFEYAMNPKGNYSHFGIKQDSPDGDHWEVCDAGATRCRYRRPIGEKRKGFCGLANFINNVECEI